MDESLIFGFFLKFSAAIKIKESMDMLKNGFLIPVWTNREIIELFHIKYIHSFL